LFYSILHANKRNSVYDTLQTLQNVHRNNNNNNNNNNNKFFTYLNYSICKALGIETTDKWYTHVPKPVYEEGDVTVLWNQEVHTGREVTANRTDIIIKNKKRENMHTYKCGNTCRQKCCTKGIGKEVKTQEFMYRDTTNVEPEMYDYTNNNWSQWNSNEKLRIWKMYQENIR